MAKKAAVPLTEAELRLMNILWKVGPATVTGVAEGLPPGLDLAYNTVLTTLRILEAKGFVKHAKSKDTRAFVYRASVGRPEATRGAIRHLLRRFFEDSPQALVLNLLEDETLGEGELDEIRQLLRREEGERK